MENGSDTARHICGRIRHPSCNRWCARDVKWTREWCRCKTRIRSGTPGNSSTRGHHQTRGVYNSSTPRLERLNEPEERSVDTAVARWDSLRTTVFGSSCAGRFAALWNLLRAAEVRNRSQASEIRKRGDH